MQSNSKHWPVEIRLNKNKRQIDIEFEDGNIFSLSAELLRVESPSAEVRGHSPGEKKIVAGRKHVAVMNVEKVGRYAIRIHFDDLHNTGIYTWENLYRLGRDQDAIWQAYLQTLKEHGLSRSP
ncbi:MAG: hypothetical protein CMM41_02530 [Rhodospirillaceae bacterium]|nr:hypothetical protein [Rhodospirillaceae bacterium]|tara:strand:- start:921 stop:1289 length:369 start_codon:yes stop_codon:yes gene_type:complete